MGRSCIWASMGLCCFSKSLTSGSGVTPGHVGDPSYSATPSIGYPYTVVNGTGAFVFAGGSAAPGGPAGSAGSTGPATAVTASGITLYSLYNNSTVPYMMLTGAALGMYSGSGFSTVLSSTQI
jgi:hypothetical protein